ncbi:PaaI family thioesterase [Brevibacterium album]|uniref:PaaI family thioesterase n=1 Tax=Brevibacterium album TaxID=417948 RepID=UPI0005567E39|nr:acyl-CoA thioesterase domain-containing protein [Brevibacterium album]
MSGAPPLGHLAGLHPYETEHGTFALALDMDRPMMAGGPGVLEVAMLADLALGGALRRELGPGLPMPTISMTIQLMPGSSAEVRAATGDASAHVDRTAVSRSRLISGTGEVLGDALGVFAFPALPYDGPHQPMPWDDDAATVRGSSAEEAHGPAVLDSEAESVAAAVCGHAAGAPEQAWGSTLLEQSAEKTETGLVYRPTAPVANRMGNVQGGVLFAIAVQAAATAADFSACELVSGTIDFISAAGTDEELKAEVRVRRSGRRVLFATVDLSQGERLCATVTAVFRR